MKDPADNLKALTEAFEVFTRSTQTLEESHRLLEERARELGVELAAKNRELALTNEYLNSILESMSDGVIVADTDGIITKFNRSASRILEYSEEDVVGCSFFELFHRDFIAHDGITCPRPAPKSGEQSHFALVYPDPATVNEAMGAVLCAKSGRDISVAERDAPISDRSGACIGYVKVFQDLTEIEALREQVRQIDRLAAIGEMAATVAHEIRNPLGGIRGFASLLARDIPPEDPRSRLVEKILVGTRNLNRVVDELLEYTRPMDLRLRPSNCAEVIDAAISYVETGGRPITISNATQRHLKIYVDPDKLRQVFLNILLNAVQSIENEGEILISAEPDGAMMNVFIHDTGCGIPSEKIGQVFSPFFTTKEKGTGLGLAIAAKIVDAHGGALRAESDVGVGTTIVLTLPKAE
jgi:nitrogen fixation/metabolism regulation signal transduction histidine kinase